MDGRKVGEGDSTILVEVEKVRAGIGYKGARWGTALLAPRTAQLSDPFCAGERLKGKSDRAARLQSKDVDAAE